MPTRQRFLLPSLAATLLIGTSVLADDKTAEIDRIFSWATPDAPGCAVAVSQHGKVLVNRAYGSADLERDVPIRTDSVFDIGSAHKQFVAAAALLLVEDGRISLSDDIRKHIPELPDYGHKVTVDHLLTHTSGIRDWTGLLALTAGKDDALTMILRQRGLNFAPGEEWSYSNSGFVLAKEIIARASRMSFRKFARSRIFEPLGMKSTTYSTDMLDVVKNRALAYEKNDGEWKMAMRLEKERGGGGVLSTTGDLLIWNDALTSGKLGKFVTEKIQEPATLNNGRKLGYARGLMLTSDRGHKVVWHGGGAAGYKTLLARFPDHGLSIAICCNSGDGTDRVAFAQRIYDLFAPITDSKPAEAKTSGTIVEVDPHLTSKAGMFFKVGTGEPLPLVVDKDKLRIPRGPTLETLSKDRFRNPRGALFHMSGDEFELHFVSADEIEMKSMEGNTTRYNRANPNAMMAEDLQAFAGKYSSDELGTTFRIEPQADGLVIRLDHAPTKSIDFKPAARDFFQRGMMTVRFQRDKEGKVVALDYSNPVLRNVKFTRM